MLVHACGMLVLSKQKGSLCDITKVRSAAFNSRTPRDNNAISSMNQTGCMYVMRDGFSTDCW